MWRRPPLISFASLRCTNPHLASFPVLVLPVLVYTVCYTHMYIQFKQTSRRSADTYDCKTFPLFAIDAANCKKSRRRLSDPVIEENSKHQCASLPFQNCRIFYFSILNTSRVGFCELDIISYVRDVNSFNLPFVTFFTFLVQFARQTLIVSHWIGIRTYCSSELITRTDTIVLVQCPFPKELISSFSLQQLCQKG